MTPGSEGRPDDAELLRRVEAQLAGMSADDLRALLPQLMAAAPSDGGVIHRSTAPSRRRPRRTDVVTYRLRVDLVGTKPPLWRRLEIASDVHLGELHDVLQVAFGWTDSHLHRFGSGPGVFDHSAECYLSPSDVEEGEPGIPEGDVRVDEVLVEPGDELHYVYDFGDGWEHTIRLEKVVTREVAAPRALCTAGRRPGPPEDIGGIPGYELHSAATDPSHAHHTAARAEFADVFGPDLDPADLGGTPFDIDAINEGLAMVGSAGVSAARVPAPIADLLVAVRNPRDSALFVRLVDRAMSDEPASVATDVAAGMVRPYTWLLDRVGDSGITLTSAGYLPPVHVEAAAAELALDEEWVGKHNREVQTLPVLELRESAQTAGLLRKSRGKLQLTARARRLRDDPLGLWWHLAEHLPPTSRDDTGAKQAGLLLLIVVAADVDRDLDVVVARMLSAAGWMRGDGARLGKYDAVDAARGTWVVLRRLGALTARRYPERERPTPEGVAFARAALSRWPVER